MGAKEEVLEKIRALTDEQLAYRLVQCDKLDSSPAFRKSAKERIKRKKGPITEKNLATANTNIRNLVQAEIERRKGRIV